MRVQVHINLRDAHEWKLTPKGIQYNFQPFEMCQPNNIKYLPWQGLSIDMSLKNKSSGIILYVQIRLTSIISKTY